MRPHPLTPAYGIARGLCIGACMWAPVILAGAYAGWTLMGYGADRDKATHLASQETDLGSSFRTANGGRP